MLDDGLSDEVPIASNGRTLPLEWWVFRFFVFLVWFVLRLHVVRTDGAVALGDS